jgi:hypothetical protein
LILVPLPDATNIGGAGGVDAHIFEDYRGNLPFCSNSTAFDRALTRAGERRPGACFRIPKASALVLNSASSISYLPAPVAERATLSRWPFRHEVALRVRFARSGLTAFAGAAGPLRCPPRRLHDRASWDAPSWPRPGSPRTSSQPAGRPSQTRGLVIAAR